MPGPAPSTCTGHSQTPHRASAQNPWETYHVHVIHVCVLSADVGVTGFSKDSCQAALKWVGCKLEGVHFMFQSDRLEKINLGPRARESSRIWKAKP